MRRFKIKDFPNPDETFVLADLPLNLDMPDEEFDKLADLAVGAEGKAGSYVVLRVE